MSKLSGRMRILSELDILLEEMVILENAIVNISPDFIPCRFSSAFSYYKLESYKYIEVRCLVCLKDKMKIQIKKYYAILKPFI